ncbi:MAG TPA: DUF4412 domain-containing protein [Vicinamibacteria bacterium]|nr:DUF4412 domain-containing protein [Vicinamibacteria bacterium]
MRHPVRTSLLALSVAVGAAFAAAEDLTIVSRVSVGQGAPETSTQYISSGRVRVSNPESDTIFDAGTGRVVVINHKKKEYFEFTRDEMAASMQRIEAQMQQAGPLMEKMMGGKLGEVTVKKTGTSRKVAGYSCDEYTVTMGENLRYDVCSAPALAPPTHYYDALKSPFAVTGPMARRFERVFDEMSKIKGFPLAMNSSIKVMMVRSEMKSEATEVKKGPIPDSAFAIPSGYKKKDSPFKK